IKSIEQGGLIVEHRNILSAALLWTLSLVLVSVPILTFAQEKSSSPPSAVAPAAPSTGAAPASAAAAPQPKIDKGDNAWMLTSAALVLMMTIPGLFLFYGGLVRGKNVLGTIMHSFIIVALISIQWVLWGYSLAFGPDQGGIIGSLAWLGLNGVGADPNPDYAATIPHQTFMIYQLMFAIITPALITGTFAERVKFSTFIVFILLWATFIYDPLAHWVWGKGCWMGVNGWIGSFVVNLLCSERRAELSPDSSPLLRRPVLLDPSLQSGLASPAVWFAPSRVA